MRITEKQIPRLAERVLDALVQRHDLSLQVERSQVLARIEEVIRHNLAEEQDLDLEARKLLEAHLQGAPVGVDRQKLFLMIKKKLAEEKDIPL